MRHSIQRGERVPCPYCIQFGRPKHHKSLQISTRVTTNHSTSPQISLQVTKRINILCCLHTLNLEWNKHDDYHYRVMCIIGRERNLGHWQSTRIQPTRRQVKQQTQAYIGLVNNNYCSSSSYDETSVVSAAWGSTGQSIWSFSQRPCDLGGVQGCNVMGRCPVNTTQYCPQLGQKSWAHTTRTQKKVVTN